MISQSIKLYCGTAILFALNCSGTAVAQNESADEIMNKVMAAQKWDHVIQDLELHIQKAKSEQNLNLQTQIRVENGSIYSFTTFTAPQKVQNTKVLLIDHPTEQDELWLYLPALKKVTKLADSNKDRAFMGSDFQFADLVITSTTQQYTLIEENEQAWIIQVNDPAQNQYSKWIQTISKDNLMPTQIDYFDNKEEPLKTLTIESFWTVENQFFPKKSTMTNLQSHSKTELLVHSVDLTTDVPLSLFSEAGLVGEISPQKDEHAQ